MTTIEEDNSMNFTESNHSSAVLDKLRVQRDNKFFCDVLLHVNGSTFPAHKNVLAASSPYFESLLSSFEREEILQVDCENCSTFSLVLNYIYTGNVVIDKVNVIELLKLARQFCIYKLQSYCAEYLDRYMDIYNCLVICELASESFFSMPSLEKNALHFVHNNLESILNLPQMLDLSHSKIQWLISGKTISMPANKKIKFIIDWVYHSVERVIYFKDLLDCSYVTDVDTNFIQELLYTHPLFKESQKCAFDFYEKFNYDVALAKHFERNTKLLQNILKECDGTGDNLLTVAMAAAITEDGDVLKDSSLDEDSEASIQKLVEETFPASYNDLSSDNEDEDILLFKKKNLPIKIRIARSVKEQNGNANSFVPRRVFSETVNKLNHDDEILNWKTAQDSDGVNSPAGSSEEENRDEYGECDLSPDLLSDANQTCKHCSYATSVPSRMEAHYASVHARNILYSCCLCNYTAKWNKDYYQHMKEHFPGPPYTCDICSYSCDRIQPVLSHRMKHTDEKPFHCNICSYKCRTKNNLIAHVRSHTGERPFSCHQCDRSFAIKSTLDQHLVTHSDNRPYLCDTCGFSTKYQSHLIAHKRIHTGDVYTCQYPQCTYFSPKKSQLKAHMRTHMAIRSHICIVCHRGFIEKSHLVRHERIHLEDKPFKCDECEYGSSRRDKLKEHKIKHHHSHLKSDRWNRCRKTNKQIVAEQIQKEQKHGLPDDDDGCTTAPVSSPLEQNYFVTKGDLVQRLRSSALESPPNVFIESAGNLPYNNIMQFSLPPGISLIAEN